MREAIIRKQFSKLHAVGSPFNGWAAVLTQCSNWSNVITFKMIDFDWLRAKMNQHTDNLLTGYIMINYLQVIKVHAQ